MDKFKQFLLLTFLGIFIISCQTGLGERIDLEAPELSISSMVSGESDPQTNFATEIYTKHDVTILGTAKDIMNTCPYAYEIQLVVRINNLLSPQIKELGKDNKAFT